MRGRKKWLAVVLVVMAAVAALVVKPTIASARAPRTQVVWPKEGSRVSGDLQIEGAATHGIGVSHVDLVIKNKGKRRYWNGKEWVNQYVTIKVPVANVGAKKSSWRFTLSAEHLSSGTYRARAFARSVDGRGDSRGGDYNDFRYSKQLRTDLYETTVTAPADGSTVSSATKIEGRAQSSVGVAAVKVAIRNKASETYWDGSKWVDEFVRISADVTKPGTNDTGWSVSTPSKMPSSRYRVRAWLTTSDGQGDPIGSGISDFTVGQNSEESAPKPAEEPQSFVPTPGANDSADAKPPATNPSQPDSPTTLPAPSGPTQSGALIWADEFNGFDASTWKPEYSTYGDGNNELQCYRPENVSVRNGKLVLRAVTEKHTCPNGSTRNVTSGMVRSRGVTFSPGQAIEFRVKLNPADSSDQGGLWPAVWASSLAGGGWPQSGEIDWLEVMTARSAKRSVYTIHYKGDNGRHGKKGKEVYGDQNFSAQWHTVRFEYGLQGQLKWFLDGRKVHEVSSADTIQGYPAPFNLPVKEIKINLALGGSPGPLSPNAVGSQGATFEMDWIRIYRL